ncbi:fused predicted DNA-binding transcriptional regulator/predicted amino transferase domain protein, partial [Vibrio parahaemolyticus V-223/04]
MRFEKSLKGSIK